MWQTAGKETCRRLPDDYLAALRWVIHFARFEGDVAERAGEYRVSASHAGQICRFRHILPEAKAANRLSTGAGDISSGPIALLGALLAAVSVALATWFWCSRVSSGPLNSPVP